MANNLNSIPYFSPEIGNAEKRVIYFDNLRRGILIIALGIYGALFSSMSDKNNIPTAILFSIFSGMLMMIIFLLDNKYHKFSEGWQHTRKNLALKWTEVINNPDRDISFKRYYREGENRTNLWKSLNHWICIFLIVGGFLSFIILLS